MLFTSTREKLDLASAALRLRDEQLGARVVFFEPDQQTNAELDSITEAVIAELQAVRQVKGPDSALPPPRAEVEIELIALLRRALEELFDPRRGSFLRARLEALSRRITNLYFESELGAGLSPESLQARAIAFPEQALCYVLAKHKSALVESLGALRYDSREVHREAQERLQRMERELQVAFLSRSAPELEKVLEVFLDVLTDFLRERFRANLGEFAWQVVREAGSASHALAPAGHVPRIPPKGFARFREVFERHFLQELVLHAQEPLLLGLQEVQDALRAQTLAFARDPRVFSTVCSILCEGFYDHLQAEGVLDLPRQWREGRDRG